MNIVTLSTLTARKHQLNQLCTAAVEQQVKQNRAENTQLRKRRRYLAKQVLKRVSLGQHRSNRHWLHAVTMVFALWGFNDLVMPNQAMAAANFIGDNPLGEFKVNRDAAPAFADIDGDGDLDAFVGASDGAVKYYRNTAIDAGADVGFVADTAGNPLAGFDVGFDAKPTFADIDWDGDLDAFVGASDGTVNYYRNTEIDGGSVIEGSGFVADAAGNPLAGVAVPDGYANPAFADIDGDGDLDAFVGEYYGNVIYYRNTEIDADVPGTGFVPDSPGNPLSGINVWYSASPSFADIDGDGDLDAFVGEGYGSIKYFRNTEIDADVPGTGFVADAAGNPLANTDTVYSSMPAFADIDGDGDLDVFVGDAFGSVKYYRNTEVDDLAPGTGMVAATGTNPLAGIRVWLGQSKPSFADIDGDGDLDAYLGVADGTVKYYRNTEIDLAVPGTGFVADASGRPFSYIYRFNTAPTFVDIDGDDDLDLFVGYDNGDVRFHRNTEIDADVPGTGFVADDASNPLAAFDVGGLATPAFEDIDGDGDMDAFVGATDGTINYYRNTEIDTVAQGTGFVADNAGNPLATIDVGSASIPDFVDIDNDGDFDVFVGNFDGILKYYRNTEIDPAIPGSGFVADTAGNPFANLDVGTRSAPTFVDFDNDGDMDMFLGDSVGSIRYFQNSDPVPVTVDDNLNATAGATVTTVDVTANDLFKLEAAAGTFTITAFDATTANGATVSNNGGNTFSYTALADFAGNDFFTYTLDDGAGNTAVGTVLVNVDVSVDINAPVIEINAAAAVDNTNVNDYDVSGSCSVGNGDVTVSITDVVSQLVACTASGNWSATFDVSAIADGAAAVIIDASQTDAADNTGTAETVTVAKDTTTDSSSGGSGALNPWSFLLLPVLTLLRRKK